MSNMNKPTLMSDPGLLRVARHVHLAAQPVSIRTAKFNGRDHVVVPIVALAEGVIQALGSTGPELVLASELALTVQGWNGRPVMNDHPLSAAGEPISANDPSILESASYGQVFNVQLVNNKLTMEEWIDPAKAEALGGEPAAMLARSLAGAGTPVSVGVSVYLEPTAGVWNGKPYVGIWRGIGPDHLANLPENGRGACSSEMGCGTLRAARITDEGFEEVEPMSNTPPAPAGDAPKRRTLRERFTDLFRSAMPGWNQSEVRSAIREALKQVEPLYNYIDDVWEEDGYVVYCVYSPVPGGMLVFDHGYPVEPYTTKTYKRSFTIDEGTGAVSFEDRVEVEFVGEFKPIRAAEGAGQPRAACSCSGHKPAVQPDSPTQGEDSMTRDARIAALMANQHNPIKTEAALKAATDAELVDLETLAAARAAEATPPSNPPTQPGSTTTTSPAQQPSTPPAQPQQPAPRQEGAAEVPQLTREQIFAADPTIGSIVTRFEAAQAKTKSELVGKLRAAQSTFTEAELNAMDVEQLTKLAAVAKVDVAKVDYSARGASVTEATESFVPPDPYAGIKKQPATA